MVGYEKIDLDKYIKQMYSLSHSIPDKFISLWLTDPVYSYLFLNLLHTVFKRKEEISFFIIATI